MITDYHFYHAWRRAQECESLNRPWLCVEECCGRPSPGAEAPFFSFQFSGVRGFGRANGDLGSRGRRGRETRAEQGRWAEEGGRTGRATNLRPHAGNGAEKDIASAKRGALAIGDVPVMPVGKGEGANGQNEIGGFSVFSCQWLVTGEGARLYCCRGNRECRLCSFVQS